MEVRIGITHSMREIELDLDERVDREDLKTRIDAALADNSAVLWLVDRKGREVAVPAEKIAYVELGTADDHRRVGFTA